MDIIYGIDVWSDYERGGVTAIFSTYEKAKEYASKIELDRNQSVEIVEMKVDDPEFEGKTSDYRHGK